MMSHKALLGKSGVGKSYTIKSLLKDDPNYGLKTASTGIAAINLQDEYGSATTVNSALGFFDVKELLFQSLNPGAIDEKVNELANKYNYLIIDECFVYDQRVLTEKGWVRIGLLYDRFKKGNSIKVWSRNKEGKLELRPIINAQKNKLNNKDLVEVNISSSNSKRNARLIRATLNHEIYTPTGKVQIKDLQVGDEVIVNSPEFNSDQKSIIVGSLLGDGSMNYSLRRNSPTFRLTQGYRQKEYLEWKHKLLGDLASPITRSSSGYCDNEVFNFITKTTPYLHKVKSNYNNKNLTDKFINSIDLLAVAIWYLDNGHLSQKQNQLTLHTERYSKEVNERLAEYLNNSFGFNFIVCKSRSYYYLRLRKEDLNFFLSKISKYIPICMSYKTNINCNSYNYDTDNLDFSVETIKSIKPYCIPKAKKINKNRSDYVYDLTVDVNHNYIAGNILVSNCSMFSSAHLDLIHRVFTRVNEKRSKIGKSNIFLHLVGDFGQLPCIEGKPAFMAKCWQDFDIKYLTEVKRQSDKDFIKALHYIRTGDARSALPYFQSLGFHKSLDKSFNGTTILSKNRDVDSFNELRLSELHGRELYIDSERSGRLKPEWKNIPEVLKLKIGALVMILMNNHKQGYANGDLGIVEEYDPSTGVVEVRLLRNNNLALVERVKVKNELISGGTLGWVNYMPLRLGWASSVHKAQGLTLDNVQVSMGDSFMSRCHGLFYVALSRARSSAGLRLVGNKEDFLRSPYFDPIYKEIVL